jgi:hypothetical protein
LALLQIRPEVLEAVPKRVFERIDLQFFFCLIVVGQQRQCCEFGADSFRSSVLVESSLFVALLVVCSGPSLRSSVVAAVAFVPLSGPGFSAVGNVRAWNDAKNLASPASPVTTRLATSSHRARATNAGAIMRARGVAGLRGLRSYDTAKIPSWAGREGE